MHKITQAYEFLTKSYARLTLLSVLPRGEGHQMVLRKESWIFLKRSWGVFWSALKMWVRLRMPRH